MGKSGYSHQNVYGPHGGYGSGGGGGGGYGHGGYKEYPAVSFTWNNNPEFLYEWSVI